MKYFYDTEFLEDGATIELISIGIVAEDGREYYAVNSDAPWTRIATRGWLCRNVVPHLPLADAEVVRRRAETAIREDGTWLSMAASHPRLDFDLDHSDTRVKPKWVIANEVQEFLLKYVGELGTEPELWAYKGAYDHVALMQLWGPMVRKPDGLPMWTHDLMQLREAAGNPERPPHGEDAHDALADARWNVELYRVCRDALDFGREFPAHDRA